MSARLTIPI